MNSKNSNTSGPPNNPNIQFNSNNSNNSNQVENSLKKLRNNYKKENNANNKWAGANFNEFDDEAKEHVKKNNYLDDDNDEKKNEEEMKNTRIEDNKSNLLFPVNKENVVQDASFKINKPNIFTVGFTGTGGVEQNNDIDQTSKKKEIKYESDEEEEAEEEDENLKTVESNLIEFENIDEEVIYHIIYQVLKNINNVGDKNKPKEKEKEDNNPNQNEYKEKLKELNYQLIKLRRENDKVGKLKIEYEKLTKKLNKDIQDFHERKDNEIRELEQWKEEELRRIQKEKKIIDRNVKSTANTSSKKDKEEIDTLKAAIIKIQDEYKMKENNNKLMIERLRKQLDEANNKIADLSRTTDEIKSKDKKNISNKKVTDLIMEKTESKKEIKEKGKADVKKEVKKPDKKLKGEKNVNFDTNESNKIIETDKDIVDAESYDLVFPEKYHPSGNTQNKIIKQEKTSDGKIIKIYENDKREIFFPSGVRKELYPDGYQAVFFSNKDIKQAY